METVKTILTTLLVDVVTVTLLVAACACQISSLCIPGWWYVPADANNRSHLRVGLWSIISCTETFCRERPTETTGANAWLQVTQVFETVAALLCTLTLLFYCLALRRQKWTVIFKRLCICLTVGAGVAILIGVAVFVKKAAGLARFPPRDFSKGYAGWAMGVAIAASILSFFSAAVVVLSVRTTKSLPDTDIIPNAIVLHEPPSPQS